MVGLLALGASAAIMGLTTVLIHGYVYVMTWFARKYHKNWKEYTNEQPK